MKAVGNLTEFVRQHMLDATPIEERIQALLAHFDDLTRAHRAVQDARRQVEQLQPLLGECTRLAEMERLQEERRRCRDALRSWFAERRIALLERRLEILDAEAARLKARSMEAETEHRERGQELLQLTANIAANGGDRLAQLEQQLAVQALERQRRQRCAQEVAEGVQRLGLPLPADSDGFVGLQARLRARLIEDAARDQMLEERKGDLDYRVRNGRDRLASVDLELRSLRSRRSNIDARLVELRALICQSVGDIPVERLPFAGELIQVRPQASAWEGAIERYLRGFGLSLLVEEALYPEVSDVVERTHLGMRLVYFRVGEVKISRRPGSDQRLLYHKLQVAPQSPCRDWIENELAHHHDVLCCENMTEFRREAKALSLAGQVKGSQGRHEKDDRRRIDDRSAYILGWSNAGKIEALEQQRQELAEATGRSMEELSAIDRERRDLRNARDAIVGLQRVAGFPEMDVRAVEAEIARLTVEQEQLRASSDLLMALMSRKRACEEAQESASQRWRTLRDELADCQARSTHSLELLQACRDQVAQLPAEDQPLRFAELAALQEEVPDRRQLTLESAGNIEESWRDHLQNGLDARAKQLERLRERILEDMGDFRREWPLLTQEVDRSLAATPDYQAILRRLTDDDLPRFAQQFKDALNENTIREIVNFQGQLQRERREIAGRIETINVSLAEIDYHPGRYILLMADPSQDAEVMDFQRELRACTEHTLAGGGDDAAAEAKFNQVVAIIGRLRGRDGLAEADQRWREKVTDVRHWFTFSASERWRHDDHEHEHYADSGGKSGGQKEKLAYTVLAASLAYQFGLGDAGRSRCFRFVVIDEAFGRGSDESARFGLELFQRMELQLLIATPLQKIHVIEPFVAQVGFVHNPDGMHSMIRNLTIDEYRAERRARAGA